MKKEQALTAMTERVVEQITRATETEREVRQIVAASVAAKHELAGAIDNLAALLSERPCLQVNRRDQSSSKAASLARPYLRDSSRV